MSAADTPGKKTKVDLTTTAEKQVDRLLRAARRNRWWNALLTLALIATAYFGWQTHTTADTVKSGAVSSCQAGNRARATNRQAWDAFISLLITNPNTAKTRTALLTEVGKLGLPAAVAQGLDDIINANWTNDPANVALAKGFEAYIAQHEYPVNCAAAYHS